MLAIDSGAVGGGKKTTTTTKTTTKTTTPAKTTTVNAGVGASAAKKNTTSTYKAPNTQNTTKVVNNKSNDDMDFFTKYFTNEGIATLPDDSKWKQLNNGLEKNGAKISLNTNNIGTGLDYKDATNAYKEIGSTVKKGVGMQAVKKNKRTLGKTDGGSSGGRERQTIETLPTNGYYDQLLDYFKDKNEEARNSAIAAIMQRLNTLKGMYGTQMEDLDEEYQKLINQNEVQRYKSKGAIREALANRGQLDSGLGRQEQLYLDTKYGNQTSNLKAQKQKAKQDIQNLINQAIAEAEADKAETNNAYNNALLQYELANA